jgi:endothelin-converting enzyme/putative endopeptidase
MRLRTIVRTPLLVALLVGAAAVSGAAQDPPVTEQPTASRSGIDLAAMDRTANACVDFYQFACGGWMAKHPIPADKGRYSRFDELQDRNDEILRDILEGAAKSSTAATKQIGDYYASCMNEAAIESKGLSPLKTELDAIAGMKSAADLPRVLADLHKVGTGGLFGFGSVPDFKDASQVIGGFGQGGMGLPDRDYYLKTDEASVKLRGEYVQHVARMLQLAGDTPETAQTGAKAVLAIETALAKAALDRVSRRNPANVYHKMTVDEAVKLTPAFDMAVYLREVDAPQMPAVNVSEPEFLKAMNQIVASTPLNEVKTYLRWHLLHGNAHVLPKAFDDETFAFYGKTLTGAKEQRARWKRCVDAVDSDLGEALGKIYVERTFGAEGKERTLQMVKDIEAALGRDIGAISWMSDATKAQARIKLQAVANKIGYPDRWRDYSALRIVRDDALGNSQRSNAFEFARQLGKIGKPVDKSEWHMTPPTVNAYYNPLENNINFPAGILQPPFFNKAADDAVNYGAAGAVVGHELTHGFDDQGRRFDAEGNLRDWWTEADGKAFDERAACVADEYSGFTAVDDVKLNGRLTLGENVADNGGLRLGWMALMEEMKKTPLAEADGFTPEQRFFIGWAQMWCENRTDAIARLHAQTNPHSPGRYRTNGVVSNFPEFLKAFSCQPDAKMANVPMCRVW